MRRLILHVGIHKTGTSYLQLWLHKNRATLLTHGVAYPDWNKKLPSANHHPLSKRLKEDRHYERVAKELAEVEPDASTLVLSSETLGSLFTPLTGVAPAFHEAFSPYFDIRLVIYVRRQDAMVESAFAEKVKTARVESIDSFLDRPMEWDSRADYMASVFGDGNITVRPFYPRAWSNGHLGEDFLEAAGLPALGPMDDIERVNESNSRRKTLYLSTIDKGGLPNANQFVQYVAASKAIGDDGIKWLLSPEKRQALIDAHHESNQRLCERYFDGRYLEYFVEPVEEVGAWFPAEPITREEHQALQLDLWRMAKKAERELAEARLAPQRNA